MKSAGRNPEQLAAAMPRICKRDLPRERFPEVRGRRDARLRARVNTPNTRVWSARRLCRNYLTRFGPGLGGLSEPAEIHEPACAPACHRSDLGTGAAAHIGSISTAPHYGRSARRAGRTRAKPSHCGRLFRTGDADPRARADPRQLQGTIPTMRAWSPAQTELTAQLRSWQKSHQWALRIKARASSDSPPMPSAQTDPAGAGRGVEEAAADSHPISQSPAPASRAPQS